MNNNNKEILYFRLAFSLPKTKYLFTVIIHNVLLSAVIYNYWEICPCLLQGVCQIGRWISLTFSRQISLSQTYFIVSVVQSKKNYRDGVLPKQSKESSYQAKQRRNITSASLKDLNSATPLSFQIYRVDYSTRMKNDDSSTFCQS